MFNKRLLAILWIGCIIGSWAIIPYLQFLNLIPSSISLKEFVISSTIQTFILYGILLWLSYVLIPKTNLRPFISTDFLKRIVVPGIMAGILVGLTILFLDKTIFQSPVLSTTPPPWWIGLIASLYGGINEEVMLRLFFLTLLYFLLCKIFKKLHTSSAYLLWTANILAALVFGLGHLPAAFQLIQPSNFEVLRILVLNGIPGLVFGWLYWSKSFWTAALAHFVCDLVIHVIFI